MRVQVFQGMQLNASSMEVWWDSSAIIEGIYASNECFVVYNVFISLCICLFLLQHERKYNVLYI